MKEPIVVEVDLTLPTSFKTKALIERSKKVGCFCCTEIFLAVEIREWVDEGNTPICPKCGIDSVLGDAQGVKLDKEYLEARRKISFEM